MTDEVSEVAENVGDAVEAVIAENVEVARERAEHAEQTAEVILDAAIELERSHIADERFAECHRMIELSQTTLRELLADAFSTLQTEMATLASGLREEIVVARLAQAIESHEQVLAPPISTEVTEPEVPPTVPEVTPEATDPPAPAVRARPRNRLV